MQTDGISLSCAYKNTSMLSIFFANQPLLFFFFFFFFLTFSLISIIFYKRKFVTYICFDMKDYVQIMMATPIKTIEWWKTSIFLNLGFTLFSCLKFNHFSKQYHNCWVCCWMSKIKSRSWIHFTWNGRSYFVNFLYFVFWNLCNCREP